MSTFTFCLYFQYQGICCGNSCQILLYLSSLFAAGILVKSYRAFLLYLSQESLSNRTVPFFYNAPGIFVKLCCIFLLYLPLGSVSNCTLPFYLYVSGIIFNRTVLFSTVPLFCSHLYVPSVLWIQIRWIRK